MSRYKSASLRIVRRFGPLPGLTRKTTHRKCRPGQHGSKPRKLSDYGVRLEEKQKIKFNYGLSERQLFNYVKQARRVKGSTGQALLQLLEMRLDNTVFRLGMAPTIPAARQLVSHGHIYVNAKRASIPSFQCCAGDTIKVKDSSKSKKLVENYLSSPGLANVPTHLELDKRAISGVVKGIVDRKWVGIQLNELLVVEHYSRKA